MFSVNSLNSVTKNLHYSKRIRTPAISCVRDQHATTAPAQHMWGTGSLNSAQFMLQWFIWFPEFAEFSENFSHLGKTPLDVIWFLVFSHGLQIICIALKTYYCYYSLINIPQNYLRDLVLFLCAGMLKCITLTIVWLMHGLANRQIPAIHKLWKCAYTTQTAGMNHRVPGIFVAPFFSTQAFNTYSSVSWFDNQAGSNRKSEA